MTEARYITNGDLLSDMMRIERASFPSPWDKADVLSGLNSGGRLRFLGLFEDGKLIGWSCLALYLDESHLLTIAIDPPSRRSGHGKSLLSATMRAAADAGARYMELECRKSNTAAQAFYRQAGFIKVGVKKAYYTDSGEDALIYVHPALPEGDPGRDPYLIRK